MTKEQVREILDRVLAWPPKRQEDAARLLAELEQQDANPRHLSDEQVERATSKGEDKGRPYGLRGFDDYDPPASSRKLCTASNSLRRFFSMTIVWVPSASAT
jgi:hypothetical protein